jgi:hypothetical protein
MRIFVGNTALDLNPSDIDDIDNVPGASLLTEGLPHDLLLEVLMFCDARALARLASTEGMFSRTGTRAEPTPIKCVAKTSVAMYLNTMPLSVPAWCRGWTAYHHFAERVQALLKSWRGWDMAAVLGLAAEDMELSDSNPCGKLLCAMKSESVKETLTALRQYVGERVKSNAGDAEVMSVCSIWEAVGKEGGAHRMESAEGCVYVARAGSMDCKDKAAVALRGLAMHRDNKVTIARSGGVPVMVEMMTTGTERGRMLAAGILWVMSFLDVNKVAIVAAGGISVLVSMLLEGCDMGKMHAAGALMSIAYDNVGAIVESGGIPALVSAASFGCDDGKGYAVGVLRELMRDTGDTHHVAIVAAGWIPVLSTLARTGSDWVKNDAAEILKILID